MRTGQISPSANGAAVTPSDTDNLPNAGMKGWSVNADGYVCLYLADMDPDSDDPLIVGAKAGVRYPDIVTRIMETNTTATGINVYW